MNKIIIDKKAFSWFCISEKSKFPSNVPKDSHTFNLRYFAGGVFFVPRASTPSLIDKVNALPLLI